MGKSVLTIAVVIVGLIAMAAGTYYIFVPTWKVFLALPGFWIPLIVWMVGQSLLGAINVPIGLRVRDVRYAVNLLGFGGPIAVLVYAFTDIAPGFEWPALVPVAASLGLYVWLTHPTEKGVGVPLLLIWGLGLLDVVYFHYVMDLPIRELMWWGFFTQYQGVLVADLYRGFRHADAWGGGRLLSFGGAGAQDALWSAPSVAIVFAYLGQWLFWGGLDATILPP